MNDSVQLRSPAGEMAVISRFGGHIISWTDARGTEQLYLSPWPAAPGRPIRGGVPVCFPQFASRGLLAKHGFARTRQWTVLEQQDPACVRLQLEDDEETRSTWPHAFRLELQVALLPERLDVRLHVSNSGTSTWSFMAALHTYLRMTDVTPVALAGLEGLQYEDALKAGALAVSGDAPPDLRQPVDRVYRSVPRPLILREGPSRTVTISQRGFEDIVVWNPGVAGAAALGDMPAEDAVHMLCVEAARIAAPVTLAPGASWSGSQQLQLDPR